MEDKDYRLILVGNTQVGLMGLKTAFEELKDRRGESESALKELLVDRVGKKNYIPNSIREEYKRGLFWEFKRFLGEKVEKGKRDFVEVTLLGLGCFSKGAANITTWSKKIGGSIVLLVGVYMFYLGITL
jgi:hypothetical protein